MKTTTITILAAALAISTQNASAADLALPYPDSETEAVDDESSESFDEDEPDIPAGRLYFMENNKPYPLDNVDEDWQNGRFAKILADAEQVLLFVPEDESALFYKAYALYGLKRYEASLEAALQYYNTEDYTEIEDLLAYLGSIYSDRTLAELQKLIDKERETSDDVNSNKLLSLNSLAAFTARYAGKNRLAVKTYYPEAIRIAKTTGDDNLAYNQTISLSSSQLLLDEPEEALKTLEALEKDGMYDLSLFLNKSTSYRDMGKMDKALEVLDKAIADYPDVIEPVCTKMTLLVADGKYQQAIELADEVLSRDSINVDDHEAYLEIRLRRGMAYKFSGDNEKANADFDYVATQPDSGLKLHALAYSGKTEELEKAIQEAGPLQDVYLASIYCVAGLTDKALPYMKKALQKQQLMPRAIMYDVNFKNLFDDPRFKKALKQYNNKD